MLQIGQRLSEIWFTNSTISLQVDANLDLDVKKKGKGFGFGSVKRKISFNKKVKEPSLDIKATVPDVPEASIGELIHRYNCYRITNFVRSLPFSLFVNLVLHEQANRASFVPIIPQKLKIFIAIQNCPGHNFQKS